MKRFLMTFAVGIGLIATVVGILTFAHSFSLLTETQRCAVSIAKSRWPAWIGCTMAAHENLAGGLIGGAGALFAAWLAYMMTQEQIRRSQNDAREAARLRTEEKFNERCSELDSLRLARAYLRDFEQEFPNIDARTPGNHFALLLGELHVRARVYLSESASEAPYGFGLQIKTVMWRLATMAKTAYEQRLEISMSSSAGAFETDVREAIVGVRNVVENLSDRIPNLEKQIAILRTQLDGFEADAKVLSEVSTIC